MALTASKGSSDLTRYIDVTIVRCLSTNTENWPLRSSFFFHISISYSGATHRIHQFSFAHCRSQIFLVVSSPRLIFGSFGGLSDRGGSSYSWRGCNRCAAVRHDVNHPLVGISGSRGSAGVESSLRGDGLLPFLSSLRLRNISSHFSALCGACHRMTIIFVFSSLMSWVML